MRIRKNQIVFALIFLGFFAFSNYYIGIFSFTGDENTIIDPPAVTNPQASKGTKATDKLSADDIEVDKQLAQLQEWRKDIKRQREDNKRLLDDMNKAAARAPIQPPPTQPPQRSTNPTLPPSPTKAREQVRVPVTKAPLRESKCHYNTDRDYEQNPLVVAGKFEGRFEPCDIPCLGKSHGTVDASSHAKGACVKSIFFTMENMAPSPGSYDIVANTDLTSDVPLPYFNWVEYDFKRPAQPKTADAHVAAFISNCGPQKRLNWMRQMMDAGVKIDSYGACAHSKEVPAHYKQQYGADYNAIKQAIISTYKFTMSFENSGTKDYVTEKLFGVLAAGSVPLYDGAPNGKIFGPSPKSMLFADDFGTPQKMAEFILYLDSNDTAYQEYLSWKFKGPSDDFTALMDIGNVHSSCRLCIRTADMHRKEIGQVNTRPKTIVDEPKPSESAIEIVVRSRGKFWMRSIYLEQKTLSELKEKIQQYVPHEENAYIYSIYEYWSLRPINNDADVATLQSGTELEAIYVVPQIWNR